MRPAIESEEASAYRRVTNRYDYKPQRVLNLDNEVSADKLQVLCEKARQNVEPRCEYWTPVSTIAVALKLLAKPSVSL